MCTPAARRQGALPTVLRGKTGYPTAKFTSQTAYSTCLLATGIYRVLFISLIADLFLLIWRQFINETSPLIGCANLSFVLTILQVFWGFFSHTDEVRCVQGGMAIDGIFM